MNGNHTSSKFRLPNKALLTGLVLLLPFILVAVLMITAGSGQVTTAPKNAKIHQVEIQPVVLLDKHSQQHSAYGRIEASSKAEIGFELAGKVTEIMVDEGDSLVNGQLLAKLDTARLDATMQELNATLQRAEADFRLAKLSEQRIQQLVEKNLESAQRLDEAVETSIAAQALVNEIKAKQNTVQVEISKSSLYASTTATVLKRPVDPGTVVAAGQPILTTQHSNAFEVRIGLAKNQAFSLAKGQVHQLGYGDISLNGTVK